MTVFWSFACRLLWIVGLSAIRVALLPLLLLAMNSAVDAHGTHPRFIEPGYGAAVKGNLIVHVAPPGAPLPYLQLRVLKLPNPSSALHAATSASSELERRGADVVWEELLPQSRKGFYVEIDTETWQSGYYAVEVKFLGDVVDETYVQPLILFAR